VVKMMGGFLNNASKPKLPGITSQGGKISKTVIFQRSLRCFRHTYAVSLLTKIKEGVLFLRHRLTTWSLPKYGKRSCPGARRCLFAKDMR